MLSELRGKNGKRNLRVCKVLMFEEQIKCYMPQKGDKIAVLGNTKRLAEQIAEQMELSGIKVKIGKNPETNIWSIAILETPTCKQVEMVSELLR